MIDFEQALMGINEETFFNDECNLEGMLFDKQGREIVLGSVGDTNASICNDRLSIKNRQSLMTNKRASFRDSICQMLQMNKKNSTMFDECLMNELNGDFRLSLAGKDLSKPVANILTPNVQINPNQNVLCSNYEDTFFLPQPSKSNLINRT